MQEVVKMKTILEKWNRFVEQAEKDASCPDATQNLELNTKNRNAAIQAEHIQYGPLNLSDEGYWEKAAEHWNTTQKQLKNLVVQTVLHLMYPLECWSVSWPSI